MTFLSAKFIIIVVFVGIVMEKMRREIKKIIQNNSRSLIESGRDLRAIFEIMFRASELILSEHNDGFRIIRQTYGQIRRQIVSAAAALYGKLGQERGYVALEMENSPKWIVGFWAILMSGNKPYLVNTRYPSSLSDSILKTLGIRYVVCDGESKLAAQALAIDSLKGEGAVPESVFADEFAISSSATSMNEVVCFYTGAQVAEQILNFKSIIKAEPRMTKHYKGQLKHLAFLPFYHIFGLFAVYFWFTFFGRTLVFLRDYGADTILKTCRRHQVTHIFVVPLFWHTVEKQLQATLAEQPQSKRNKFETARAMMTKLQNLCPSLGAQLAKRTLSEVTDRLFGRSVMFCISGGSYLRDSAIELFNSLGYGMHNGYGMSEIGITSVELRRRPKHRNLNAIGKPFDAVEYRLNEEGILQVRGGTLCVRKLVNGQEISVGGDWFDTGDYMECIDGHYYIKGRKSDVVIGENGENINPDTVEQRFNVAGAQMLSVLGLGQADKQELSLVVQIHEYASEKTVNEIREAVYAINATLPSAMAVRKFYFTTDALASAGAVKVGRKQLTRKIAQGEVRLTPFAQMAVGGTAEQYDSPLLGKVRQIIAQALGVPVEAVDAQAHIFFDLGGTSIQYFTILSRLAEAFSIEQADKDDKYCYTAKEICEYIERRL